MPRASNKTINLLKTKQDKRDEKQAETKSEAVTTPITGKKSLPEDEYSPIQIRCTQDGGDDELDVGWDWSSPQSRVKRPYNRQRKRSHNISPQVPRKLQSKHNLIPKFTALKAELEKLSRHEDQNLNSEGNFTDNLHINRSPDLIDNILQVNTANRLTLQSSDPFGDDSFDDELIKCSQQVEATITKPQSKKIEFLVTKHSITNIADDSFDAMLTEFTDEDIARLSQENERTPVKNTPSRKFYRTNSTPVNSPRLELMSEVQCSTPLRSDRFPRTKSANDCSKLPSPNSSSQTCSPEEIEKKRLEAKARLELKKFQNEIEKKRLEALEKLKRNRMQRNTH